MKRRAKRRSGRRVADRRAQASCRRARIQSCVDDRRTRDAARSVRRRPSRAGDDGRLFRSAIARRCAYTAISATDNCPTRRTLHCCATNSAMTPAASRDRLRRSTAISRRRRGGRPHVCSRWRRCRCLRHSITPQTRSATARARRLRTGRRTGAVLAHRFVPLPASVHGAGDAQHGRYRQRSYWRTGQDAAVRNEESRLSLEAMPA